MVIATVVMELTKAVLMITKQHQRYHENGIITSDTTTTTTVIIEYVV